MNILLCDTEKVMTLLQFQKIYSYYYIKHLYVHELTYCDVPVLYYCRTVQSKLFNEKSCEL